MSASRRRVTVLGSSGSIGVSTLDVLSRHPDRFELYALSGHRSVDVIFEQCLAHRPAVAVMACPDSAAQLESRLAAAGGETRVLSGEEGLLAIAAEESVDIVMAAIVGAAGLEPTLAGVRAGKTVLLANKESLVMAGGLFMTAVAESGAARPCCRSIPNTMRYSSVCRRWTGVAFPKYCLPPPAGLSVPGAART